MFRSDQPLYLPKGSVRSILALAIVAAYFVGAVSEEIVLLVLGSYFVGRASQGDKDGV